MKPTIGRIVLVKDMATANLIPAIIVFVHNDTCINVRVFEDNYGLVDWRTSLVYSDSIINDGQWTWPPRV